MVNEFANLDGKRILVTGGSSGLGRAAALEFGRAGADVLIHCGRSVQRAQEVAAQIRAMGPRSDVLAADFRELAAMQDFPARAWQHWGSLDVVLACAGADLLTGSESKLPYQEKLQLLYEVDLRAGMLVARALGAQMKQAGRGSLILIGWDQADHGMEGDSGELFAAAKNGIMGFSRSLALSLAPEVRVNCIAPGWIRTAWGETASEKWQQRVLAETPLKRWGLPEDIAATARFLASDAASFITGQVLNVNGGAVR